MKRSRFLFAILSTLFLAAGCGGPAAPSGPEPRPLPSLAAVGDSAAWFEEITSVVEAVPGQDTVRLSRRIAAATHLVRVAPDTLRGYYEALLIRMDLPNGTVRAETDELLGQPFLLVETDSGMVTVDAPPIPSDVNQMVGLENRFGEVLPFWLELDLEREVGMEWTDTLTRPRAIEGLVPGDVTAETRYRVLSDSVYEGMSVQVLQYSSRLRARALAAAGSHGDVETMLEGTEHGTIIYAPARDLLVEWQRRGELAGTSRALERPGQSELPQTYEYEASTRLLLGPAAERVDAAAPGAAGAGAEQDPQPAPDRPR